MDIFPFPVTAVPNFFAAAFTAWVAAMMFGLTYLIEYKFYNRAVFSTDIFPAVVPELKPGNGAAFWAGYRVAWRPYLAWRLLSVLLGFRIMPVPVHYLFLVCSASAMTLDRLVTQKVLVDPVCYHQWFFRVGAAIEVVWLVYSSV